MRQFDNPQRKTTICQLPASTTSDIRPRSQLCCHPGPRQQHMAAGGHVVDCFGVCVAGGVRAAPGAEDLRTFVEALAPLDGPEVGRLLAGKMVRV